MSDDNLYDDYSGVEESHGTPLKEAEATFPPEADWEGHDDGVHVGLLMEGRRTDPGNNPFTHLAEEMGDVYDEWSEADIQDALRKALNEVRFDGD